MRYALQEKAARIRAMMNRPEEPKPRERKKGKDRASESETKERNLTLLKMKKMNKENILILRNLLVIPVIQNTMINIVMIGIQTDLQGRKNLIYGEIKKNQPSKPAKRKHPDEYSDSEDEFDGDLDGFVVDYLSSGEEEEMDGYDNDYEDYSKHIRNIFGYDRRKFKYESDYDIANMESNFKDVMKEEARSARLGMQDGIDIKT
ncbi:SPT2 [Mytilus edulis]|uniref:SPTY2D1 n=1 Tax=Mytilus edulis TaxID=6550 RepID=A0A8S3RK96_MYTED|nr:SPT2 [Mytilus edulis]